MQGNTGSRIALAKGLTVDTTGVRDADRERLLVVGDVRRVYRSAREWAARLLRLALLAAAASFLASYLMVALLRLRYPFELEWMEGGAVDHVKWILSGRPLYGPPSLDFVPYIYTPLYFYLSALVAEVTGLGFFPLRLVSFAASLGCLVIIYRLVARETNSAFAGFVAVGLFAATYRLSGSWFDIARVDSLLLLLVLSVLYMVRLHPRPAALVVSGVLAWLAFLAKQSGAFILAPVLLGSVASLGRRSLLPAGIALGAFLAGNWLLDRLFRGWFSYYVFDLPRAKTVLRWRVAGFWTRDLLPSLFIVMLISALYLGYELRHGDRARGRFYLAAVLGMVGGSWLFRVHSGTYYNVLMPAHAAFAILSGLALGRVEAHKLLRLGLCAGCLAQFALLVYHPLRLLPSPRDREAGRALIATLATIKGEVYLPEHGYLTALAGKRSYAHGLAIRDVYRGDAGPAAQRLRAEVGWAARERRFAAWVLDSGGQGGLLTGHYVEAGRVFDRSDVFWPVTGMRTRPERIYLPVPEMALPP
jgi:4-amino-4-deoxy-L-arabinose transferase-like glycosyltransferase